MLWSQTGGEISGIGTPATCGWIFPINHQSMVSHIDISNIKIMLKY